MTVTIRRLGPTDKPALDYLSQNEAEFDVTDRSAESLPLTTAAAHAYLTDPHILHWVAEDQGRIVGFLVCYILSKRAGNSREVVLYEIGVNQADRRQKIGSRLLDELDSWLKDNNILEVWVLADNPIAVKFYEANGFVSDPDQPTYMQKLIITPRPSGN